MQPNHHERLTQIARQMPPQSLLMIRAPMEALRNRDVFYPFRSCSEMLYLTGLNEPGITFLMDDAGGRWLFFPQKSHDEMRWTGPVTSTSELKRRLKLPSSHIYKPDQISNILPKLLPNYRQIYSNFGSNSENDLQLVRWMQQTINSNRREGLPHLGLYHSADLLDPLRQRKDPTEIHTLRQGCEISAQAHNALIRFATKHGAEKSGGPVHTEHRLKTFLETQFFENGAERLAYPSIVAAGNNANILHYERCNSRIGKNDLVLVDAGCEWENYATDITRTFPISGKFTAEQKVIYEIVLRAQKKAIRQCKPGSTLKKVHEAALKEIIKGLWDLGLFKKVPPVANSQNSPARASQWERPKSITEVKKKNLFRHFYMHSTSHWLGLDVHDVGPYLDEEKKPLPLQENMVFTVEPGIYLPKEYDFIPENFRGIGIRIEDDILITATGHENLTKSAVKEIAEIEHLAAS